LQSRSSSTGTSSPDRIEIFEYPAGSSNQTAREWSGYEDVGGGSGSGNAPVMQQDGRMDWKERMADESRKAFEAGCERGRQEAREAERETLRNARRDEEQRIAGAVKSFAEAREQYLRAVEGEVVRLALAVAARILRREAQMDPLLLTGAVRVALGQLSSANEVKLRVPGRDLDLWREAIAHVPNLALRPEVIAGEGLRLGDCLVESTVGTVDLGIRSQLGEIERGFFDCAPSPVRSDAAPGQTVLRPRDVQPAFEETPQ
jgi:flagellar biosynthesis/type III secretory pathway protein FliH